MYASTGKPGVTAWGSADWVTRSTISITQQDFMPEALLTPGSTVSEIY